VYDLDATKTETHTFEPGRVPCEAVFAPADTATNHGWLHTYVYDANTDRSGLVIIDINRVADEPVAVVHLPQRVPYGFHGSWFPNTGDRDRVDQRDLAGGGIDARCRYPCSASNPEMSAAFNAPRRARMRARPSRWRSTS
jgi:hypothetical protein